ncbi:MAG: glycosyltransferase family 10 [Ferruginibacter sp.]
MHITPTATIKINFTDFWEDFDKTDNFFFNLLSQSFNVEITEQPEILFYSCYGNSYRQYNCIKVFYASENNRPDFSECDYALSFDFSDKPQHLRLPLYYLYYERHGYHLSVERPLNMEEARLQWRSKTKFCCMLVSNPNATDRIHFFEVLNKMKRVDSGGRYLNNIGHSVADKTEFIKDYRFVISFENAGYPGYTTEKIMEPMAMHCIPIYFGNPAISKDFNTASFINVHDFETYEDAAGYVLQIDADETKAVEILTATKQSADAATYEQMKLRVGDFLEKVINNKDQKPVSASSKTRLIKIYRKVTQKLKGL